MKTLQIEFERRPDGSVVSNFVRPDGTRTWERHRGHRADYFPWHDLIHLAIESRLRLDGGFYGLIADGWDIADMGGKGSRGRLPATAVLAEHLAGLFGGEVRTGHELSVDDVNAHMANTAAQLGVPAPVFSLGKLADIRREIQRLQREWTAVPQGSSLSLEFAM